MAIPESSRLGAEQWQEVINYLPVYIAALCLVGLILIGWLVRVIRRSSVDSTGAPSQDSSVYVSDPVTRISLGLSFSKAVNLIRRHLGSGKRIYTLPWYLMIGLPGSGKNEALSSVGLSRAFADDAPDSVRFSPSCTWWFFDKGVVLDAAENLLLAAESGLLRSSPWRRLLRLLQRYRPLSPLNGVILAVPADLLLSRGSAAARQRERQARLVQRQLWDTLKILGVRFPIYVLVTKMDAVPGFGATVSELPAALRSTMLGWSNPNTMDTLYSRDLVGEAFREVGQHLIELQTEISAAKVSVKDGKGVFLLPAAVADLKDPLSLYLDTIFESHAYDEPYALRGIYFTGSVPSSANGGTSASEVTQSAFLDQLFSQKVFKESALAQPLKSALIQRNRRLIALQFLALAMSVVLSIGLYQGYRTLQRNAEKLPDVINEIDEAREALIIWRRNVLGRPLRGLDEAMSCEAESTPAEPDRRLKIKTLMALKRMSTVQTSSYESLFIPDSYSLFSDLRQDVRRAMVAGYKDVVVPVMCWQLRHDLDQVMKIGDRGDPESVRTMIRAFSALEELVGKYNGLRSEEGVANLPYLLRKVFSARVPENEVTELGDNMWIRLRATKLANQYEREFPGIDLAQYKRHAVLRFLGEKTVAGLTQEEIDETWKRLDVLVAKGFADTVSKSGELRIVSDGQRLWWNAEKLSQIKQFLEDYEKSVHYELQGIPVGLQSDVSRRFRTTLEENVEAMLSKAQIIASRTRDTANTNYEGEIRSDAKSLQDSGELLIQILNELARLDLDLLWNKLLVAAERGALSHLSAVDRMLDAEGPYMPSVSHIPIEAAADARVFRMFGFQDAEGMGAYLVKQRERMDRLANDYAGPAVRYLSRTTRKPRPAVFKWSRIMQDLNNYANGQNSPVMELEQFLLTGLQAAMTIQDCPSEELRRLATKTSGDFFLSRKYRMASAAIGFCVTQEADSLLAAYEPIRAHFNSRLAGRFPFIADSELKRNEGGVGEAEPGDVRLLMEMLEQLPADWKEKTREQRDDAVYRFLTDLAAAGPLLRSVIGTSDVPPKGLDLKIGFRINRNDEVGANQIAAWMLQLGTHTLQKFDGDTQTAVWHFGEPVHLVLRWAKGSFVRPVSDLQGKLTVKGTTATFSYTSPWALLKFVRLHSVAERSVDGWQQCLQFQVPLRQANAGQTNGTDPSRVYIGIGFVSGAADGETAEFVSLPVLPVRAP